VFRCEACGAEASEVVVNGIIAVPPQCSAATCGRKQTLRIIPNRCAYANRQVRVDVISLGVTPGQSGGGGEGRAAHAFRESRMIDASMCLEDNNNNNTPQQSYRKQPHTVYTLSRLDTPSPSHNEECAIFKPSPPPDTHTPYAHSVTLRVSWTGSGPTTFQDMRIA